ncbi:FAD dependent oxidoreductase [Labedella gwakjiensis]|uniref:FAD-dependent oxidoreductase n=1 Tax=Labedella gwakjiensis TaxID=390269 RepID=A0A2P8GUJ5_9MICO|nr:FAD-dependent oxidoreductase [Labedella gwakjiensis]PSL37640.1 FAD dependent oxidoreductase [Labedella gwakjiensis]RUQ87763.1 FAD-dependent oxidoreductase [Labedella gwakjiensis]
MTRPTPDLLVIGGGIGGVAAALTAVRLGRRVVLTEQTDWLGGQLTSQAVPPDENAWIEGPATGPGYTEFRRRVRDYYRRNYPLTAAAAAERDINPGLGVVSRLCHEPRVALAVIEEMLAPWIASGRLEVLLEHRPVAVEMRGDEVASVTVRRPDGAERELSAPIVVDATELGDLLALGDVEHVIGAEGRDDTGELHAPETANPLDQQAISWCFALEHRPGEDHVGDRPERYEHWLTHVAPFWPGPQLSWTDVDPISLRVHTRPLFQLQPTREVPFDLWRFRRILAAENFREGTIDSDVTIVNWPQIDYWEAPILGVDEESAARALTASRELSASFLYWMQTEAPREDGGTGYRGLRLRGDVTGTDDGYAKAPYIREARRALTEFRVLEQHVGVEARGAGVGSEIFDDSVGIGHYRIDLHPSTSGRTYVDIEAYPFQIPLGALLPVRVDNLLPAAKNIGSTHITNGCYRLHPVEWAIGEAVGALASFALDHGVPPRAVRAEPALLDDYRRLLTDRLGVTLQWSEEVRTHHWKPEPVDAEDVPVR